MPTQQTSDLCLIIAGLIFLACALIGIHLWQRQQLVIFTGWLDLVLAIVATGAWLFLGFDNTPEARAIFWISTIVLLIGAGRVNKSKWQICFALPARMVAAAVMLLLLGVVFTVLRSAIASLEKLMKRLTHA